MLAHKVLRSIMCCVVSNYTLFLSQKKESGLDHDVIWSIFMVSGPELDNNDQNITETGGLPTSMMVFFRVT